jgi:putative copper export protein
MDVLDWILVLIRWGHALGAVAWVGGGIFYILVLRPAFSRSPASADTNRAIGSEFRGLVNTAIGVLVITGIILSASRLTVDTVTIPYVAVLTLKVALAVYMFYIVRFLRQRAYPEDQPGGSGWWHKIRSSLTSTAAVLVIGVAVFGLSDVLGALFENSLSE